MDDAPPDRRPAQQQNTEQHRHGEEQEKAPAVEAIGLPRQTLGTLSQACAAGGDSQTQQLLPVGSDASADQAALEGVARGVAPDLAARRLEHRIRRRQHDLVGRQADHLDGRFVDLLAQRFASRGVFLARLGEHDQPLAGTHRVVAGEHCDATAADSRQVADRLFEFVRIEVATAADDQILDPAGQVISPSTV
jgi:hypothetical protein